VIIGQSRYRDHDEYRDMMGHRMEHMQTGTASMASSVMKEMGGVKP
jgi:hypothetical protein